VAAPKQKTLDGFFKAKPTAEAASQDSAAEKAKAGSCEQPVKVTIGLGNKKHDCEGRVITVEYKDFYIAFVYVPNAGEGLKRIEYRIDEWDQDLRAYLKKVSGPVRIAVIGGS
jgi:exonuclease III